MIGGASPEPTPQRLKQVRSAAYRAGRDRGLNHIKSEEFADFCVSVAKTSGTWLTLRDAWLLFSREAPEGEST